MDLGQLITALEEFIYEIALWPILLLKTLLRFALRPLKTDQYVRGELAKIAKDRYRESLSPLLFWILIGVVPAYMVITAYLMHSSEKEARFLMDDPVEVRFAALLIFLIWPPLTFAVGLLIQSGERLTRETLRYPFYTQCMILAPLYAVVTAMAPWFIKLRAVLVARESDPKVAVILVTQISFVVFCGGFMEARLLKAHLPHTRETAYLRVAATWVLGFVVMFFLEVMALLVVAAFRPPSAR